MLLCTDLDRTLLPNGEAPEHPLARPLFRAFVARPEVALVYVSGRSARLIRDAIEQFDLPEADHAVGDVGTSVYDLDGRRYERSSAWDTVISADWNGRFAQDLAPLFGNVDGLEPQEEDRQSRFKQSYYVDLGVDRDAVLDRMRGILDAEGVRASLVWSVDEERDVGLLDVLPAEATKLHAVRFLRDRLGVPVERTVFAGDSGNDLDALASDLPAVLVANASEDVRREAVERAGRNGTRERLFLADGHFLDLGGCYAAGILEGVAHFLPDARAVLVDELARLREQDASEEDPQR